MNDTAGEVIDEILPEAFDQDRIDRVVSALTGRSRSAAKALIDDGASGFVQKPFRQYVLSTKVAAALG